jgi:2-oxoglutarate dehydrogenase E2 component (dihydrolipoamide succinyltransferase)
LKKITRHEVEQVIASVQHPVRSTEVERTPLSPLRRKLSKRLVAVKNETAMLTTFNEVDMSSIMDLRKKYQSKFQEKHGQKLGLVSFFTMACTKALLQFPRVNSYIDGDDMVTPNYVDIAIAVQTDKGLMAPVIRNTGSMNLAQMERAINELAEKARALKLSIEEMTGGTFTITNGGVFGSMLSTPILNPPQSAILGMHNIVERPVAIKGKVEIRPVMYVALSYDHRLIDGRESVSFLVKVKQLIESPVNLLLEGADPEKLLLGL